MLRLIVADAQAIVRAGLKRVLNDWSVRHELAEAANARDLWSLITIGAWQALLLDLTLPGADGLGLLRQIQAFQKGPKVLVWGGIPEERFAVEAIRLGSYGYVSKQDSPSVLVQAFEQVTNGKRYISPRLGELMAAQLAISSEPHELLSARERQVFDCLASGMITGQVAKELSLTDETVSTYRSRICKKCSLCLTRTWPFMPRVTGFLAVSNLPRYSV